MSHYFNNLNASKTKVMHFDRLLSGKNITSFGKVVVNNIEIEVVDRFKYVGFILDDRLCFCHQVNQCIKQANHKLYLL